MKHNRVTHLSKGSDSAAHRLESGVIFHYYFKVCQLNTAA